MVNLAQVQCWSHRLGLGRAWAHRKMSYTCHRCSQSSPSRGSSSDQNHSSQFSATTTSWWVYLHRQKLSLCRVRSTCTCRQGSQQEKRLHWCESIMSYRCSRLGCLESSLWPPRCSSYSQLYSGSNYCHSESKLLSCSHRRCRWLSHSHLPPRPLLCILWWPNHRKPQGTDHLVSFAMSSFGRGKRFWRSLLHKDTPQGPHRIPRALVAIYLKTSFLPLGVGLPWWLL